MSRLQPPLLVVRLGHQFASRLIAWVHYPDRFRQGFKSSFLLRDTPWPVWAQNDRLEYRRHRTAERPQPSDSWRCSIGQSHHCNATAEARIQRQYRAFTVCIRDSGCHRLTPRAVARPWAPQSSRSLSALSRPAAAMATEPRIRAAQANGCKAV